MKTTKRTKVKIQEHSKKTFLEMEAKKDDASATLEKFLFIMEHLTKNQKTITIADAIYYGKGMDLNIDEVKRLFIAWTDKEVACQRLEKIEGCMDYPIFKTISAKSFASEQV